MVIVVVTSLAGAACSGALDADATLATRVTATTAPPVASGESSPPAAGPGTAAIGTRTYPTAAQLVADEADSGGAGDAGAPMLVYESYGGLFGGHVLFALWENGRFVDVPAGEAGPSPSPNRQAPIACARTCKTSSNAS
jgi:hypothetical protein